VYFEWPIIETALAILPGSSTFLRLHLSAGQLHLSAVTPFCGMEAFFGLGSV